MTDSTKAASADFGGELGAMTDRRSGVDAADFGRVVRLHQDGVYRFCLRMMRQPAEAEEVAQEVFFAAYRGLGRFRGDAKMSTWLFSIARNKCLNRLAYLRRRDQGRSRWAAAAAHEDADRAARPDDVLEAAESEARMITRVRAAIDALPDAHRSLILLRDIEQLSYEEIAAITGLRLDTVKSRIHRARARLARAVGGKE